MGRDTLCTPLPRQPETAETENVHTACRVGWASDVTSMSGWPDVTPKSPIMEKEMSNTFVWFDNRSARPDATVAFYTDLLGWQPTAETPHTDSVGNKDVEDIGYHIQKVQQIEPW